MSWKGCCSGAQEHQSAQMRPRIQCSGAVLGAPSFFDKIISTNRHILPQAQIPKMSKTPKLKPPSPSSKNMHKCVDVFRVCVTFLLKSGDRLFRFGFFGIVGISGWFFHWVHGLLSFGFFAGFEVLGMCLQFMGVWTP